MGQEACACLLPKKKGASLKPREGVTLEELLLAANRALFVGYVLRDALKNCGATAIRATRPERGAAGTERLPAAASSRCVASLTL
jgi:hypothetical protein